MPGATPQVGQATDSSCVLVRGFRFQRTEVFIGV
jgi:hypothetical protein